MPITEIETSCRLRYAFAPCSIAFAMNCIFSVPDEIERSDLISQSAKTRPSAAQASEIGMPFSIRVASVSAIFFTREGGAKGGAD